MDKDTDSSKVRVKNDGYFERFALISEYFWALFGIPCQLVAIMMNAFLLKLWLWIPTDHELNAWRLLFCALVALPTVNQAYYGSIQWSRGIRVKTWSNRIHRFDKHCVLWLIMMASEIAVIYRVIPPIPPMPDYNKYWLSTTVIVFALTSFILCRKY